jgi:hypothetical protein
MIAVAVTVLASLAASSTADARPRPGRGKKFESNKTYGLGLELGSPTGVNGKYFLEENGDRAIEVGIGYIDNIVGDRSGLHLYGDYLWHPLVLVDADAFEMPLFFGGGLRYFDFDYGNNLGGYALGVRVPFGVSLDFNNVPVDIYLTLAPVLDFIHGYDHDVYPDFDVSLGARFWFE